MAVVTGNQRSEFTYDGFSRRTKIVEKVSGTVTSTKQFVWVGGEIAEERDGNNVVQKKFFGLGEWRNGVGNLVYTFDHLGSLREMTQADGALNGTVRARYEYDPYGRRSANLITGGNALAADWGFTGHYFHANSGLHLAWFRAYDAHLGRWISRDPIEEEDGPNLYSYVENDPVNWIDEEGLSKGSRPGGRGGGGGRSGGRGGGRGRGPVFGARLHPWQEAALNAQRMENSRRAAIREAWRQEQALVRNTGRGTRDWTEAEKAQLLSKACMVKGYDGHHINNAALRPDLAGNPNNIAFRTRPEHLLEHRGDWRISTYGPLLNREVMQYQWWYRQQSTSK